MQKYKDTIRNILQRNVTAARLNPDQVVRHPLKHGLHIDMMFVKGRNAIKLQLWRDGNTPPSLTEWKTVIDNWPLSLDDPEAIQPERCYLIGELPIVTY